MSQEKREELEALAAEIKGKALDDVYPAIRGAGLQYGGAATGDWEGQKREFYWSGSHKDYWGLDMRLEGDNELITEVEVYDE
jgi:hypothetical protein